MGYYISYEMSLMIKKENIAKALEIFNHLHTDEMLLKYANGGSFGLLVDQQPVKERRWYSWIRNPSEPYTCIKEAFQNWKMVEESVDMLFDEEGNFTLFGTYNCKIGQQDFLLKQLESVLEDTKVFILGEDGDYFSWNIVNHTFSEQDEERSDDENVDDEDDENKM